MNYPTSDFRYLLTIKAPREKIIQALAREPLVETLRSWKYIGTPPNYVSMFCQALEDGISSGRYPSLNDLREFPEFHSIICPSLYKHWLTYPLYVDIFRKQLYIGPRQLMHNGYHIDQEIKLSPEEHQMLYNHLLMYGESQPLTLKLTYQDIVVHPNLCSSVCRNLKEYKNWSTI